MECKLVHKYPVTEGCYQQVIQPGIKVVHDPLVKYLFRISGNLGVQVTGLAKLMSQDTFQICLLPFFTPHSQGRQQILTGCQPAPQCFKMQTLSRHWTRLVFMAVCRVTKLRENSRIRKQMSQAPKMESLQI